MADPRFYQREGPFTAQDLASKIGLGEAADGFDAELQLVDIASLEEATQDQLSFFTNPKLADSLAASKAGAVLIKAQHAALCPADTVALVCPDPYLAMAQITQAFYPHAAQARPPQSGLQQGHVVHPDAEIGQNVEIQPGAIIGPGAQIGDDCFIGSGAYIGHGVVLGRRCSIGANAAVAYSLLGDAVIVHGGAQIGVDGFGFAPGAAHTKIPQLGRVILQAGVEIGGNCAIDRGALGDTVIGEGSKLDNLVHIAHNVKMGRHCFITASVAIAGSTVVGDYVQMGGGAKVTGHVSIGDRSIVAAMSAVLRSIPADSEVAGAPARPRREVYRDQAFISRLRKRADDEKA